MSQRFHERRMVDFSLRSIFFEGMVLGDVALKGVSYKNTIIHLKLFYHEKRNLSYFNVLFVFFYAGLCGV